jgi:hypothetical protein
VAQEKQNADMSVKLKAKFEKTGNSENQKRGKKESRSKLKGTAKKIKGRAQS